MSMLYKKSGVDILEAEKLCYSLGFLGKNFNDFSGEFCHGGLKIFHCCDGIGTKIIPLYEKKYFKTIAIDLVAANLNDLVTKNAKAVAFCDYIAVNKLDSHLVCQIISELQKILKECDCTLIGGETSEMPALLKKGCIDICGFATGIAYSDTSCVEFADGDLIIALKSNGVHANGFSLIRRLFSEGKLSEYEFEKCLAPSFIYYNTVRKLWDNNLIKSAANITGGGIVANLKRIFPDSFSYSLDFSTIPKQNIYEKLYQLCGDEIYCIFNCGVGFCIVADEKNCDCIFDICKSFEPFIFGKVVKNDKTYCCDGFRRRN